MGISIFRNVGMHFYFYNPLVDNIFGEESKKWADERNPTNELTSVYLLNGRTKDFLFSGSRMKGLLCGYFGFLN